MSSNPSPEPQRTDAARRGNLKIYLGYAPHTGKTWRLLEEARRRKARGQDVVVGWLRTKDRPAVASVVAGLEVISPRDVAGQPEMDRDAILQRAPYVCVIDELAHANAPGSHHAHRWEDVEELLAAGIGVVTAVNIQHVAGMQGSVAALLGQAPEETVPDALLRGADEVVLVDATPESLLARPARVEGRPTLSDRDLLSLRELALLYAAAAVEEEVQEYKHEHHIDTVWETQERIMVCLTPNARGPHLIDRAHQAATRWKGEWWAITVMANKAGAIPGGADAERLQGFLELAKSRGAKVEIVEDSDPVHGVLTFARQHDITQIFLGHAEAYPFRGALSRTVAGRIILEAEGMDVHVVADDRRQKSRPGSPGPRLPLVLSRLLAGAPRPEARGHHRIYLGYAPGVGKTFQMLLDGRYLSDRGQDVVVGFCHTHGRDDVVEQLGALEKIPPLMVDDGSLGGMDVEAVLRRHPQVCLVDGLAQPAGGCQQRWQQVEALRDAGIHVLSTLDVGEVASLQDTVERITNLPVRETVPDWLVDQADEVVMVDVATRALINRLKRGAIFPGREVPDNLHGLFTEGSLNALRELAMRLTADRVEDELDAMDAPPATGGRKGAAEAILVCLHERPAAASLIRRGRRMADRLGAPCYAVYVVPDEDWTGLATESRAAVEQHLDLARSLHVETHVLAGSDVARTLVDFIVRHHITQVFLGRSRKRGWREFFRRSVIEQVIRLGPWLDVQVVAER